jgi:hypothetical protein
LQAQLQSLVLSGSKKALIFFKIKAFWELDERFELSTLLLQGFAIPASPPLSRPFGGGGHLFSIVSAARAAFPKSAPDAELTHVPVTAPCLIILQCSGRIS